MQQFSVVKGIFFVRACIRTTKQASLLHDQALQSSMFCPEVRQWAKYVSSGNLVLVNTTHCGWPSRGAGLCLGKVHTEPNCPSLLPSGRDNILKAEIGQYTELYHRRGQSYRWVETPKHCVHAQPPYPSACMEHAMRACFIVTRETTAYYT